MNLLLLLLPLILLGFIASRIALRYGLSPIFWFTVGFAFGLIGLLILGLVIYIKKQRMQPIAPPKTFLTSEQLAYKESRWFYLDDSHQPVGPLYFEELSSAWKSGQLKHQSYVWRSSMPNWQPVHTIQELQSLLSL